MLVVSNAVTVAAVAAATATTAAAALAGLVRGSYWLRCAGLRWASGAEPGGAVAAALALLHRLPAHR